MMDATPPVDREARIGVRADALAGVLLLLLVAWVLVPVRPGHGGRPAELLLFFGVTVVTARALVLLHPALPSAVLVTAGAVLAVVRADVLLDGPLESPLGYANATAAFYLLVSAAAVMAAARLADPTARVVAGLAAVGAGLVPWLNGADAAAMLVLLPPAALAVRPLGMRVRGVVAMAAALAAAVLLATIVLGATYTGDRAIDRAVGAALSERRPQLWGDAADLVAREPVTGVGVGGFAAQSPTALADADAVWAHHEVLQVAAETGVPGAVLLVALLAALLWRLWLGPRDPATGVAALALAALVAAASIDYVLHFWPVVAAAGLLAGAGVAPAGHQPRRRRAATSR